MYAAACPTVGDMAMPADFKYRDVALKGRPQHGSWDSFSLRHPPMPPSRWAKIFSPFDALEGFDERLAEKEVQYETRAELSEEDTAALNAKLTLLRQLTRNSRLVRANPVTVTVLYFVPCTDEHHFACHMSSGRYESVRGTVLRLEPEALRLRLDPEAVPEHLRARPDRGELRILFRDLRDIRSEAGLFTTLQI